MLQFAPIVLGSINVLLLIMIYRKTLLMANLGLDRRQESLTQKSEESNVQNILSNRLLDIQNRKYSIKANLRRENDI